MPRREFMILAAVLAAGGLGVVAFLSYHRGQESVSKPAAAPVTAAISGPIEPGFDVIRVTRDGQAVMAGRAAPGARVTIKSGDQIVGQVTADKRGDWVIIAEAPLKTGAQVLRLQAQIGKDSPVLSRDSAVISVPDHDEGEVFAAISRPGRATRILNQGSSGAPAPGVAVAGVDLTPKGGAVLSGRAEPGRHVRIYLDNQPAGEAVADQKGDWELSYPGGIGPGEHKLRGDQIDAEGKVLLRAEAAFSRVPAGSLVMGRQQVVVMQGNALWEIAHTIYGSGVAYSVIFTGNRQQIRDPDLIYPGQVFDIPAAGPAASQGRVENPISNTIP
ncbi:MAG: hypothetical protein ABL951_00385 [Alphaproteobacteria bacterium]